MSYSCFKTLNATLEFSHIPTSEFSHIPTSEFSHIPTNLFIAIVTHKKSQLSVKEIRTRWECMMKILDPSPYRYDFRIFDANPDLDDVSTNGKHVTLPTGDGYHDLTSKTRHIRKYAIEKIVDFFCLLKIDDDVFVHFTQLDNWLRENEYCSTSPEYLYASHDMSMGLVHTRGNWENKEYSKRSAQFPQFGHGASYLLGRCGWLDGMAPIRISRGAI